MPLATLKYPDLLNLSSTPITHTWSESESMIALGKENSAMINSLSALSFRGLLGLRAALGEWMQQRFSLLYDDEEHANLNEAIWAASIDFRYLNRDAMVFPEDNVSPIHGPLQLSKFGTLRLCNAYYKADFGAVRYVANAANLVKFVLNDSKQFKSWFKLTVTRLAAQSSPAVVTSGAFDIAKKKEEPRGVSPDIFGIPIPREACDPNFELADIDRNSLIDEMLRNINSKKNPFLFPKEKLLSEGFIGNPYRYPAD